VKRLRDRSGYRRRVAEGYNGGSRLGPQIGSTVRLDQRRQAVAGSRDWRGEVRGADLRIDCAFVVWSHQPTILHRIPYSWLAEVTS